MGCRCVPPVLLLTVKLGNQSRRGRFQRATMMPLASLTVTFLPLCILSSLATVRGHTYLTEPLFLPFSDLAALGGDSLQWPNAPPVGDHKIKTFAVNCDQDGVEVVMEARLLDPAVPVEPGRLRLGPVGAARDPRCAATVAGNGDYVITAPLAACGSAVTSIHSAVLYNNFLQYSPPPPPPPTSPGDQLQAEGVSIPVVCEYRRRYPVSSPALKPTWIPPISGQSTHLLMGFHLRLMTNDWSRERKSSAYFLGEVVNVEASVDHHHLPLRLYADSCVATLTSDVNSHPRHPFIDRHGCFTDSQLDGSSSRFLPRVQDELLHIQLEPFLFRQDHRHTIYITCYLEAEPSSNKPPGKKACWFDGGRWRSADGDDHVCGSCGAVKETNHIRGAKSNRKRALRSNTEPRPTGLHQTILGPIIFLPFKIPTSVLK
ncbi:zona pellucida sperm-binding protein 3 isoform X2 [Gasterosteus aculeatus]